ncbi:phenylalanine--tRNA ligase subunit beta [Sulfurimonas sp.]|jgi:phenylalanyl-tRNA synthetase beta chain|uniref:phenylalanine--tRNA ligase subunit beta n=1 Tax=Sulfurimonas sp. TaxID=2022749 RepID=UPI002600E704|nr:phenylalanine--tRNA ligase subunit beta [Sulfurimonas sp.]MBT5934470.1 phenylalanine--tRNA ligase subunit beta [Sulfurimonas sp.]
MIVTKSWLNEWIDLRAISTDELAKTFNAIGLEVDRVHEYRIPKKIIFGKVLECEKHPDADKLNVCQVDIGSSIRQIVCGASNVRAGLTVVVAVIGAQMPSGLTIKPVQLRGVDSDGMICSAEEIGLPDLGDGILEIDESIGLFELGQEVNENSIFNDDLIEIELTANRGDCLSIRGVARDLSAAFDRPINDYIETDNDEKRGIGRVFSLIHEKNLDVNLQYKALDLKELEIPLSIKLRLAQIEENRECDIEALLLYVTQSTGVILRAYKHDFFCAENKKMANVALTEDENGFACISGTSTASIVGIIQNDESKTAGTEGTILLEASYIPPEIISKKMSESKMASGPMFYKTSRGSEPELTMGISYCVDLIESHSRSSTFSGKTELTNPFKEKIVIVTKQEIDNIIGAVIDKIVITKILKNLGFNISKSSADNFVISVPQFRHDILNKQDIVEEIVRMVGIDNIPSKPFLLKEDNRLEDNYFEYKKRSIFRHRAASTGFNESVHFVFDEKKVLNNFGFQTTIEELELLNPIVQTLDTLRPTLLTGLLKATSANVKNGYSSVKLFEIGSVFTPTRDESYKLAMIFSGDKEQEGLSNSGKPQKIDFAYFTQKVSDVIGSFELRKYNTLHTLSHDFQTAEILIDGTVVGELFRTHPHVEKEYDLETTFMCEIDFEKIPYSLKIAQKTSKYQASFRDLSVIMPQEMSYEKVKTVIEANATQEIVRFYPVDRYSDDSLGESMSLSLRFVLQSTKKTLEEEDITLSMNTILESLQRELGIGLR